MSPLAPSADNVLLGKGELFFDRFDANGVSTGYLHLGNVDTFELTTADEVAEKFENMTAAANLYKSVTKRRNVTLRIVGSEFNAENVAAALMGVQTEFTQVATPVVDEILTAATKKGAYYKFSKLGPHTGITIEKGPGPGSALVAGTDYELVDTAIGLVRVIPTSVTLPEGSSLLASYTPTLYTAGTTGLKVVQGGMAGSVRGRVLFKPDPSTGPKLMVEVWKVSVSPEGSLSLISEDYADLAMTMAVEEDRINHPTEKLYKITYLP